MIGIIIAVISKGLNVIPLIFVVCFVVVFLITVGIIISYYGIWIRALVAGAKVTFIQLIQMRLKRIPPNVIIDARILAVKAEIEIPLEALEAHYLSGGNLTNVMHGLIAAKAANVDLDFKQAAAIDLAGYNVLEAVQKSMNERQNEDRSAELTENNSS